MSKTIALRKLITVELNKYGKSVYYKKADKKAKFPYIVYSLENVDLNTYPRDDIELTIDIWDRNEISYEIEALSDKIEKGFNRLNKPTDIILPTFYVISKRSVDDEDEEIERRQIKISIQSYEIEEG